MDCMRAWSRKLPLVALLVVVAGCGGSSESGPLSPARALEGTWEMAFPVTVYFDNDWCTPVPSLMGSQEWKATWVITPGATDNDVRIQMSFTATDWQQVQGCPDAGVIPEVSPMFLTGNVSAATLTVRSGSDAAGSFTFTDWNIQGDFDYTYHLGSAFTQREYTTGRTFILRKL
jgi:hypothetical protein